jgi:hypothetical protein
MLDLSLRRVLPCLAPCMNIHSYVSIVYVASLDSRLAHTISCTPNLGGVGRWDLGQASGKL